MRVCLDCETESTTGGACPECGGPTIPTDPERAKAHKLYLSRYRDVLALLTVLRTEAEKHAEFAEREGVDYGYAGDMGEVRARLVDVLAFLAERDAADIERALASTD